MVLASSATTILSMCISVSVCIKQITLGGQVSRGVEGLGGIGDAMVWR